MLLLLLSWLLYDVFLISPRSSLHPASRGQALWLDNGYNAPDNRTHKKFLLQIFELKPCTLERQRQKPILRPLCRAVIHQSMHVAGLGAAHCRLFGRMTFGTISGFLLLLFWVPFLAQHLLWASISDGLRVRLKALGFAVPGKAYKSRLLKSQGFPRVGHNFADPQGPKAETLQSLKSLWVI